MVLNNGPVSVRPARFATDTVVVQLVQRGE